MRTELKNILNNSNSTGRESLIHVLQEVQDKQGYLSKDAVIEIGAMLNLPTSKIYGVATFYNQFRFKPLGQYHIQVCRGTACHVKGSASILGTLEQELKIKAGETTRDDLFSIEVVACIGACGLAPVISINGEFYAGVDNAEARKILKRYKRRKETVEEIENA
jgi:NADH-quinone oxidoreductase subunit E